MERQVLKNIAVVCIAFLVAFTSCKKEYIELAVENETVEFTINPMESKTVTIHSNTDWSLEIQQVGVWLSVTPANGQNDGALTLTAQVNDNFAERYATITVTGGDVKEKIIAVMQQGDKTQDVILLDEMHHIDNSRYKFEYDAQHRLTKRYQYNSDGALRSTMTLTYNDDDDLTAVLWVDVNGWTIQPGFTKEGNKISFRGVGISLYEIELNTEELPEKRTHYWRGQMVDSWSNSTHTYKWVNRNLSQTDYKVYGESQGSAYERSGTYTYTYDDKKSPFYYCATPRWFWLWYYFANVTACSLNNLVSVKSGDDITTYEYAYNEDGFLATDKQGSGAITYTYIKRAGTENSD